MKSSLLVLAAGRGSRLHKLTESIPKGLVPLAGRPILEWQFATLSKLGWEDINIATGYRADLLQAYGFPTVHNPDWADTNMVSTLLCAEDLLNSDDDLVVSYSDIIYEPHVLETLVKTPGDIVTVVDKGWLELWKLRSDDPIADAETLRLDNDGKITEIGGRPKSLEEVQGQYIGLSKLTAKGKKTVTSFLGRAGTNTWPFEKPLNKLHFTDLLAGMIEEGIDVHAAPIKHGWLEIDTPDDINVYEQAFREDKLSVFCKAVGEQKQ